MESLSEATGAPTAALPKSRNRKSGLVPGVAALLLLVAVTVAYLAGRGATTVVIPHVQRLTYRLGTILTGRFAPDGQTIFYSGSWEGKPFSLYSTIPGGAVAVARASLRDAVRHIRKGDDRGHPESRRGEPRGNVGTRPTLRRGAAAHSGKRRRRIVGPDGENLAAVISGGGGARLEYPIGKVVYRTAGFIFDMRVSPDGEVIAVEETRPVTFQGGSGWIGLIDRSGKRTTVYDGWVRNCGVAWLPGGKEFVFAIPDSSGSYRELYAASRSGKKRLLSRFAGAMTLHDVSRDGRLLFAREDVRILTLAGFDGGKTEGIVSWLDESVAGDLSLDGSHVLLSEIGSGGRCERGGLLPAHQRRRRDPAGRRTGARPLTRRQVGPRDEQRTAGAFSLSDRRRSAADSAGIGIRALSLGSLASRRKEGLLQCECRGRPTRCSLLDLAGGAPRPVGAEGGLCAATSPDGEWLAVEGPNGDMSLIPVDGTASPRPVRGWAKEWTALQWSGDGRSLFITNETEVPMSIRKLDLETGRTELVRTLVPPDKAGVQPIAAPIVTRDGRTYAYTYIRLLGDLYVAEGLK